MTITAPFGTWRSPITAERLVEAGVGLGGPAVAAGSLWWSELRPSEAGRVQLVRAALPGPARARQPSPPRDVLPDGFAARTRVHEYGGGAWWLVDDTDTLVFANWADQRLYRIDRAGTDDASAPTPITPDPHERHAFRYADGDATPDGRWILAVREWVGAPGDAEARNELVWIPTDGASEPVACVSGHDFVSHPRLSADGTHVAYLTWEHPDLPWNATVLHVARLVRDGEGPPTLTGPRARLDAPAVSRAQPRWIGGELWFVSDESDGWWNLHALDPRSGRTRRITAETAELAQPQWVFGQSWYAPLDDGRVILSARRDGTDHLGVLDPAGSEVTWLDVPFTSIDGLVGAPGGRAACVAASFTIEPQVVVLTPDPGGGPATEVVVARPARDLGLDAAWISVPQPIDFPTGPAPDAPGAPVAHALYYPPRNPDHEAPAGERPPLLVLSHGGPTAAARPQLDLAVQFWTSRGIAVVDVNYRGSTGYGRAYREALHDAWGIADVEDCVAAARFLVARGDVDGDRLLIRGGSAGGYTTLCALTFTDVFAAGASRYGIADLEALGTDTHKFESRYLDRLVGPYPQDRATYVARSPIHHTDRLATPLIILQGLEDEVVPPSQAAVMVDALRAKGVPFAYLAFEGEQHGFRQAPNIRRALEAELYFYGWVLGFEVADPIEPVPIEAG